jgi:glutaredoxin
MITLYRVANCKACDEVQETLRDLVVAHQVVDVQQDGTQQRPTTLAAALVGKELPVIADGDKLVSGEEALRDYLAELAREIEQWRKFQVDACYIDDQGETC